MLYKLERIFLVMAVFSRWNDQPDRGVAFTKHEERSHWSIL